MRRTLIALAACLLVTLPVPARADIVINEIFYHAPDDLDDLQFIELHNTSDQPVDLAGWKLAKAVKYEFAAKKAIAGKGYVVVCKDLKQFKKYYGFDAAGAFEGRLSHSGENLMLLDASGKKMDGVKYKTRSPWPVVADGYGASLERICPTAKETGPENWAPSPLAAGAPKPGGTPGKRNANEAPALPPVITKVTFTPSHVSPEQEVQVAAEVRSAESLVTVEVRYRVAGPGFERAEQAIAMNKDPKGRYTASIPGQKAGQVIRFRVHALDAKGGGQYFPHENDLRPALSVHVHDKFTIGNLALGLVINVGAAEFKAAQRDSGFGFRFMAPPSPTPPARGKSAFVYVNQKTGEPELFDFINVTPRSGGRRVRLHKDRPLAGMTTFVLIYEAMDRYALAEAMSYEVYRRAGSAAPRTEFVRTWIDGRPIGFQFQIEQPNAAFFKQHRIRSDGNLYKVQWFGNGLVDQHKKKSHIHEGHGDLLNIVDQLGKTQGDEQWAVIHKNFDVKQMATFYAVHMLLSDWDGFFNNHYV